MNIGLKFRILKICKSGRKITFGIKLYVYSRSGGEEAASDLSFISSSLEYCN
jgi:hypothetical protein